MFLGLTEQNLQVAKRNNENLSFTALDINFVSPKHASSK